MKRILLSTLTVLISLINMDNSIACSCETATVTESIEFSDVIFSGRVVGIEDVGDVIDDDEDEFSTFYKVTFEVYNTYKTVPSITQYTVFTQQDSAACGYPFAEGESYLVYTYLYPAKNMLFTDYCTRTILLNTEQAKYDIAVIKGEEDEEKSFMGCVYTRARYKMRKRWIEVKNSCSWPIVIGSINVYDSKNIKDEYIGYHSIDKMIFPGSNYQTIHNMKIKRLFRPTDYKYNFYWYGVSYGNIEFSCQHWMKDPDVVNKLCR